MKTFLRFLTLVIAFSMSFAHHATACAACYSSNTGSKMGNAANWGIIAMVVIMFAMLGAIGGFMYYLNYRAKNPLPDYEELLREDEPLTDPS